MKKPLLLLLAFFLFAAGISASTIMTSVEKKWLDNGIRAYSAGEYEKAVPSFEYVLKTNPRNPDALVYLGFCYLQLKNYDAALTWLEKAYSVRESQKLYGIIQQLRKKMTMVTKGYMYTGGLARLYALGNPRVVVPDNASIIDCYDLGFTSAYAYRQPKNMINVAGAAGMWSYKSVGKDINPVTGENSGMMARLDNLEERHNSVVVWPTERTSIIIKPYFGYDSSTNKTTYASGGDPFEWTSSGMAYGAEAESSQRINENFAIGALLGFYYTGNTNKYGDDPLKTGYDLSKFEYLLSGSYLLPVRENTLVFSLSLGSRAPLLYDKLYILNDFLPIDYRYMSTFYAHYNNKDWYESEGGGSKTKGDTSWTVSAFDIGLGAGLEMPGKAEVSAKFNFTPALSVKQAQKNEVTDMSTGAVSNYSTEQQIADSGSNSHIELKGRLFFDKLIVGLWVRSLAMSYKYTWMTSQFEVKMAAFDAAAGVTLKLFKEFAIPVELFYQSGSWESPPDARITNDVKGAKAGVEYTLNQGMALRAGFDYANGGIRSVLPTGMSGTSDSGPYGNELNPAIVKMGINAGIGFMGGNLESNITLRYGMTSNSPNYYDIAEYGETETSLIFDVRMGL